jgi:hypothetical protein
MTIAILILVVFLAAAVLMFLRKLPAILALPLMAVAIAFLEVVAGRLTLEDLALAVIADGSIRLADPMVISMFGGMVSLLMQKSGVAENFVKRGAELAGDNPIVVAAVMLAIIGLLFTTIGGLGAVIMVGTIVLPILASIGVREYVSAGVVLFGISLGGLLNANNWAVYRSVLLMESEVVWSYALPLFGITAVMGLIFIAFELIRSRTVRFSRRLLLRGVRWFVIVILTLAAAERLLSLVDGIVLGRLLRSAVGVGGVLVLLVVFRDLFRLWRSGADIPIRWYSYLIPLVPLVLILVYDIPFVTAFILGFAYGILVTARRGGLNMMLRSVIEGSASVIPAIVLMLGIGMLLSAILGPTASGPGKYWYQSGNALIQSAGAAGQGELERVWPVLADMKPLLSLVVPESFLSYVLMFSLLGPLALYRGPLNVWGLGYGVGGVLMATGVSAPAVMGILMSMGIIQGVSDPTNTQNVWLANEVKVDVNTIMWRTLPYSWLVAVLGLLIAGFKFLL